METPEKDSIKVGATSFNWDINEGLFEYEGSDAVLFWIKTSMKTFLDTMEEVTGTEAANLVIETAGYRQGIIVSQYFGDEALSPQEMLSRLIPRYAAAGWGRVSIIEFNEKEKTAVVQIKNSWEFKLNKQQEKVNHDYFFPGHFAGLLTGILGENIWYKVTQSQTENDDCCEISLFPSNKTVTENIHELSKTKEQRQIELLEQKVADRTQELTDVINEISSPIIPVLDKIIVVPLLGKYEENRSEELTNKILSQLPDHKASYMVLDLTGIDEDISEYSIDMIHKLGVSASLLGTETVLVGISPKMGIKLTQSHFDLSGFNCFSTLQHGIYYALGREGRQII
ncbi:STAS domain-containing protein [Pseudalkalibacillus caeni]|uniref:STAS domain-containing protein n=2 Tax=Exobacillus caeni TaxID=2574798 RepID=A0A5R9FCC0_9BACL|nr:STAS domain-containing protein [Pseudalkalibacillus caeni]